MYQQSGTRAERANAGHATMQPTRSACAVLDSSAEGRGGGPSNLMSLRRQEETAALRRELHLHDRRRDIERAAVRPKGGFTVIVYELTAGYEPVRTLEHLRDYAHHRRWRVHTTVLWDTCGPSSPMSRPGWCRALGLLGGGFVQGVVTMKAATVSRDPLEYGTALDYFEMFRGFLAHVPPDWSPRGAAS